MAIYIVLTVIFLVFGIIFAFNKGDFLIAGLNTSESNQNECDTKKINRMFAVFFYCCCSRFVYRNICQQRLLYGWNSVPGGCCRRCSFGYILQQNL